jgi:hypothetical protein
VKQTLMPLSGEQLIRTIENNQTTLMFYGRGILVEAMFRNSTGELERFGRALDKYPPLYETDFVGGTEIVGRM